MIPRLAHRTRIAAVALVASAALALTACTGGESGAPSGDVSTLDTGVSANIDEAVETAMQLSGSTEAVIGVWSGGEAHVRGYGDGVDSTALIRGAQTTRPVLCALLLDLAADGTVDLDGKVSEDLTRQSGIEDITYAQLCDMRSGLADYKGAFSDLFTNNPTRPWPEQELIAQALTDSPLSWPGLDVHVSDTNLVVLGRALHVATATDINQVLRDSVFSQAQMASSYYPSSSSTEVQGDTLTPLTYPSSGGSPVCDVDPVAVSGVSPTMLAGAGATVTTVTDLKNFYSHYLDGSFGGEHAERVTETLPLKNPERDEDGEPTEELDTTGNQWAFGMQKVGPLYGNSGAITGTITAAYHAPESDFTVVVALNNSSAGANFARALALQLAALASEGGAGPELSWDAADQASRLSDLAVCQ